MDLAQNLLIAAACVVAGAINAMAGGGSLISVPLLTVFADLGGLVANGTNRIGVLTQNLSSSFSYTTAGVSGLSQAVPVMIPVLAGSFLGAFLISRVSEGVYELVFGLLMVPLLLLSFWRPSSAGSKRNNSGGDAANTSAVIVWPRYVSVLIFFGIGAYGGAFQAGVGLVIVLALSRAGLDLVNANAVKVIVIAALTVVAVPVFIFSDQVHWWFAVVVSVGFAVGGWIGAKLAVRGGERLIRPVMLVAVVALAGRMVGLY